uniref:Vacuolar ATPase assembly protein VMA22 n=1 Tax=Ciona savignyi TaxID=51511 RepID=H2Z463_CIOSA
MANVDLDELSLALLEIVANIDKKKLEQEKYLQEGYLCLAKARYSMGVDRVSALQYPTDMTATVAVSCKQHEKSKLSTFSLIQNFNVENESPEESTTILRKRGNSDQEMKGFTAVDDVKVHTMDKQQKIEDPLLWFGVLVPTPLRQAQKCFKRALETSCELCTLKEEFKHKAELYKVEIKHTRPQ